VLRACHSGCHEQAVVSGSFLVFLERFEGVSVSFFLCRHVVLFCHDTGFGESVHWPAFGACFCSVFYPVCLLLFMQLLPSDFVACFFSVIA